MSLDYLTQWALFSQACPLPGRRGRWNGGEKMGGMMRKNRVESTKSALPWVSSVNISATNCYIWTQTANLLTTGLGNLRKIFNFQLTRHLPLCNFSVSEIGQSHNVKNQRHRKDKVKDWRDLSASFKAIDLALFLVIEHFSFTLLVPSLFNKRHRFLRCFKTLYL